MTKVIGIEQTMATVRRLPRHQIRRLRLQLDRLVEEQRRSEAKAAVDAYLARQRNGGGATHLEEAALGNLTVEQPPTSATRDRSGGRRIIARWHGEPVYEEDPEEGDV